MDGYRTTGTIVKAKQYAVLELAVQEGIALGYSRAHKHTDTPTQEALINELEKAVMFSINEWFDFNDSYESQ